MGSAKSVKAPTAAPTTVPTTGVTAVPTAAPVSIAPIPAVAFAAATPAFFVASDPSAIEPASTASNAALPKAAAPAAMGTTFPNMAVAVVAPPPDNRPPPVRPLAPATFAAPDILPTGGIRNFLPIKLPAACPKNELRKSLRCGNAPIPSCSTPVITARLSRTLF